MIAPKKKNSGVCVYTWSLRRRAEVLLSRTVCVASRLQQWGVPLRGLQGVVEGRFRADIPIRPEKGVNSKTLEYGPGTIEAGFPSSLGFGVEKQSYSNFLASTVYNLPKAMLFTISI